MGSSAGALADLYLISAGASAATGLASSIQQAGLLRAQGRLESAVSDRNARFASLQAEDAIKRGEIEVGRYGQQVRQIQSDQTVAAAAQGLDPTAGSPAEISEDTGRIGALDMLTIRNNAAREAFGYEVEASEHRGRSRMARKGSKLAGRSTLITGGLSFLREAAQAGYVYDKLKPNPRMLPVIGPMGSFAGMQRNPNYRR